MKRLALLVCLSLASCAPILSTIQQDDATLIRGGGVVVFTAGGTLAQDVAVYVAGVGLTVTGPSCRLMGNGVGCKLGDVPANTPARISVTGSVISGSATYYRVGSNRPYIATLKGE